MFPLDFTTTAVSRYYHDYSLPKWACEKGHERVEWGKTGGFIYEVKLIFGLKKFKVDDRRCWYCGAFTWTKE